MSVPYFTLSKSIIKKQFDVVEEIADIVSYSSKTNPLVSSILEDETDCMFSIHLENELKHIKDMRRVFFLAQGLNDSLLDRLFAKGIRTFGIDNEYDYAIFMNYIEKHKQEVTLFLRVKLRENTIKTERYFVFGMQSTVIRRMVFELQNNPLIKKIGIHFHRKTQNMSEWNLAYEIGHMFDDDVLQAIDVLNIGGGLPSEYANTNIQVLDSITKRLIEFKQFLHERNVKLMLEPGRFIAAPAGTLYAQIIAKYDANLIVNASVYNTDMDALIVPVKLLVEGEIPFQEGKRRVDVIPYVIKGKTPCSMDLFRYRVYLPEQHVGDVLAFLNAGAYNFTTNFCDLELIETKIIE